MDEAQDSDFYWELLSLLPGKQLGECLDGNPFFFDRLAVLILFAGFAGYLYSMSLIALQGKPPYLLANISLFTRSTLKTLISTKKTAI